MTDTIAERPTLTLGQRVRVNAPTWSTTDDPYEGVLAGLYRPEGGYDGSAFIIHADPARRPDSSLNTLGNVRRENRGMVTGGTVTFVPVGDDEDQRGQWLEIRRIEPLATPVSLSWEAVQTMAVGTRLLVASPRPDSEPYPATILRVSPYTVRVQYDEGRPSREGMHGERDWNLSEYPDWAAFSMDEAATASPESSSDDAAFVALRERDAAITAARAVLTQIGEALLETADRSEWCDEYDRKLERLYQSLPDAYGFDDTFNDAAKREDEERDWTIEISGHVHVTARNEDEALQALRDDYADLVATAYGNGCIETGDIEPE